MTVVPKTTQARHGTVTRYAYGCRCEPCTTANREYKQRWRNKGGTQGAQQFGSDPTYYHPNELGTMPAQCWCGSRTLPVPADKIRACETESCGKVSCYG